MVAQYRIDFRETECFLKVIERYRNAQASMTDDEKAAALKREAVMHKKNKKFIKSLRDAGVHFI